ncbi:MAG: hypothetical protein DRG87_09055 [Deltaproteobacteria bacterium]|nr:MAG: hypothetical protein DRG87_09055 [Deltaproteobacteria bacterium]
MVRDSIARLFAATFIVLSLTGFPGLANTSEAARTYDIQVGCFADPHNMARLAGRLQGRGLHWYSLGFELCTRFIVDANVNYGSKAGFVRRYPAFSDASLIENFWDMPHTPRDFPHDLRRYPKAQIYFAAHYLHKLHQEHYGNRYMALLAYNGTNNPNYEYPRKVMRFYQRAIGHFLKSSEHCSSEGGLQEGCSGSSLRTWEAQRGKVGSRYGLYSPG